MSKPAARMPSMICPACHGRAHAQSVGKNTPLYREVYYHCRNPDACGHTFVVSMQPIRTVKPSCFPTPFDKLPLTNWHAAANDRAANDDDMAPDGPAADAMTP